MIRTGNKYLLIEKVQWVRSVLLFVTCSILFCALSLRFAWAQLDPHSDVRLKTPVHLNLGETTLENVTKALSEQTGLQVEAAIFLRPRKLIIELDGVPVTTVLDTLTELYDWRWVMPSQGHVLLTRKRVQLPQNVAAIAPAIEAALPVDIRRFFGLGVPIEQIPVALRHSAFADRTKFNQPWEYGETLKARIMDRLQGRRLQELQMLMPPPNSPLLPDQGKQGKYTGAKLYYPQWTQRQQDAMMLWMLLEVMESNDSHVLLGTLPPFVQDINTAHLEIQGIYLYVRSRILFDGGKLEHSEAFGVPVPADTPLTPP